MTWPSGLLVDLDQAGYFEHGSSEVVPKSVEVERWSPD